MISVWTNPIMIFSVIRAHMKERSQFKRDLSFCAREYTEIFLFKNSGYWNAYQAYQFLENAPSQNLNTEFSLSWEVEELKTLNTKGCNIHHERLACINCCVPAPSITFQGNQEEATKFCEEDCTFQTKSCYTHFCVHTELFALPVLGLGQSLIFKFKCSVIKYSNIQSLVVCNTSSHLYLFFCLFDPI